jgi:hypothetical protein
MGAVMKRLLLISSFAVLVAVPAMAADLGAPVYRAPVVAAPVYSWAGFYVGINGGGGIATGSIQDKDDFFTASDSFQNRIVGRRTASQIASASATGPRDLLRDKAFASLTDGNHEPIKQVNRADEPLALRGFVPVQPGPFSRKR